MGGGGGESVCRLCTTGESQTIGILTVTDGDTSEEE